jgi:4-aminobutyrate aminotransferase / (S)-3-amino-2-methylpropionate transaminase / 5-aminovalerate transaminase
MEARRAEVARGLFHATPIFVARAHGAVVEDVDGNRLLDFASGIAVNNLGHTPAAVVAAVKAQAEALLHASFNVLPYEGYVALAARLNRVTPGDFPKKTFLANSGAEAVENAIKIARAHTRRQAVLAFEHAFHGRTHLAMSLTSKVRPYRHGFGPFAPEVYRAPYPRSLAAAGPCLSAVREIIDHQIGPDQLAAIIVEPVLGEGGVIPAPTAFLRGLRAICDEHGIVLVIDEIQTGFGRTGTLFACEHHGVAPDLITLAKGLGGGLPIAAVTGRAEIMDAPSEGGIGGTFGGNPLSCAAALAVLDAFEADDGALLTRARALGDTLSVRLSELASRHERVGEVRGLGAMRGIEIVKDGTAREPDAAAAGALARYGYEHGVVLLTGGAYGNVVRVLVPLVITDEQLDEGLSVIEEGLTHLHRRS